MSLIFQVNLELIKSRRVKKGYSLQKMATLVGVTDKIKYYRRENGEIRFRPEELPMIAKVLEVPIEGLFLQIDHLDE